MADGRWQMVSGGQEPHFSPLFPFFFFHVRFFFLTVLVCCAGIGAEVLVLVLACWYVIGLGIGVRELVCW
jgi:uncharacterized membrane protein